MKKPISTRAMGRLLDDSVSALMEHFDTVQIIVTKHDSHRDLTNLIASGAGNFYARMSSANEWLVTSQVSRPAEEDDD